MTPALINELRYLNACLRESMRLLPGTGGMERTAPKNLVLRGYQVIIEKKVNLHKSLIFEIVLGTKGYKHDVC